MQPFPQTTRTTVRRLPKRGVYDRDLVYAILDEGFLCHAGFSTETGPVVIPTLYGRKDDCLLIHGSAASRMLKTLAGGVEVSIAVTLVDALVLARSAFHHSINYRSVVIFGTATPIEEPAAKLEALASITGHIVPGRWAEVRPPTAKELGATHVLSIPLEEVSAKVRTGPPVDDEEDYALPVWAGLLPLETKNGTPASDSRVAAGVPVSASILNWKRPKPTSST